MWLHHIGFGPLFCYFNFIQVFRGTSQNNCKLNGKTEALFCSECMTLKVIAGNESSNLVSRRKSLFWMWYLPWVLRLWKWVNLECRMKIIQRDRGICEISHKGSSAWYSSPSLYLYFLLEFFSAGWFSF